MSITTSHAKETEMAKQEGETATKDMFDTDEQQTIKEALEVYTATMRRKINSEKNVTIKQIYTKQLQTALNAHNKTAGWL